MMSRYAYFASLFQTVREESRYVNKNFNHDEQQANGGKDMTVSAMKKDDSTVTTLEKNIKTVLKVHCKAYEYMKNVRELSKKCMEVLAFHEGNYLESKQVGLDATLLICKINANILYVEYLNRQQNMDEMGKYAKSVVSQASILETYLKPSEKSIDPHLLEFAMVSARLYKAIALWSLIHPIHYRMKTEKFEQGESHNKLGYIIVSFVNHISQMEKEIMAINDINQSPIIGHIRYYFSKVMYDKIHE